MKRTLRWPISVVGGRAQLTADPDAPNADPDDALGQVIALRLLDNRSGNPFDVRAGLQFDPTFQRFDGAAMAQVDAAVRAQFRELESSRRARLVSLTMTHADGVLDLQIEYVNLETGLRRGLEVSRGG